jgi:hypothetical protein
MWLRVKIVRNVVRPTLTAFLPERSKANGTAVILCPGGGFCFLAKGEGIEEAERLRARGVAVFILKHRLMDTGATEAEFHKAMLKAALLKAIEDRLQGGERPVLPEDVRRFSALAVADGRQAIKVVREHAGEWGIKPDRIGIMVPSSPGRDTIRLRFSSSMERADSCTVGTGRLRALYNRFTLSLNSSPDCLNVGDNSNTSEPGTSSACLRAKPDAT